MSYDKYSFVLEEMIQRDNNQNERIEYCKNSKVHSILKIIITSNRANWMKIVCNSSIFKYNKYSSCMKLLAIESSWKKNEITLTNIAC